MEELRNYYKLMIENVPQFKEFLKQTKELTNYELIDQYNIQINKEQD